MIKARKKWKHDTHCRYCGEAFGPLQDRYIVQQAVKPPKTPHRWKQIGSMCEGCNIAEHPSHFDRFIKEGG